jgi:hypothetical protein
MDQTKYCFCSRIFNIIVYILHNEGVFKLSRHNNLKDLIPLSGDIRKRKYGLLVFF